MPLLKNSFVWTPDAVLTSVAAYNGPGRDARGDSRHQEGRRNRLGLRWGP